MRSIRGHISLMSLMDLIQWASNSTRTGTLAISEQGQQKKFYFQEGKLIFVWSDCRGERIVDFLRLESAISQQDLDNSITDAKYLGLPFIGYLISEKILTAEALQQILAQVAQTALTDALKWESGEFEFIDELPSTVVNGPVKLDSTMLLIESAKAFDETQLEKKVNIGRIIDEIRNNIIEGNIELPPIPDIIAQIQEKIDDPNASIDRIVDCITDQILVSKILRICNSPYYRNASKVSTLKDAVVLIGLKSLMSIVTVHALSCFSPRNSDEIRVILRHSLVCGMIARQIARDMGVNYELAFMGGLMHDIGKTVMLDMLYDYMLSPEIKARVIEDNHTEIGCMLAQKWNFSEEMLECILFHHNPEKAVANRKLVEVIYLANLMTHTSDQPGSAGELFLSMDQFNRCLEENITSIDMGQVNVDRLLEDVDNLDKSAKDILG
jgi:putative nucleotidyltransferase with HDIG domain